MVDWAKYLSEDDFDFIKRFLLASGSLKEVARQYGISYPTMRQRIDRLIEKIRLHDAEVGMGTFEKAVRAKWIEGRIDGETRDAILAAHREALGEREVPTEERRYERGEADGVAGVDLD